MRFSCGPAVEVDDVFLGKDEGEVRNFTLTMSNVTLVTGQLTHAHPYSVDIKLSLLTLLQQDSERNPEMTSCSGAGVEGSE